MTTFDDDLDPDEHVDDRSTEVVEEITLQLCRFRQGDGWVWRLIAQEIGGPVIDLDTRHVPHDTIETAREALLIMLRPVVNGTAEVVFFSSEPTGRRTAELATGRLPVLMSPSGSSTIPEGGETGSGAGG